MRTRDEHLAGPGPKRILALDGGGLRGILTLGILERVERELRARHGDDPDFRLCHYFDLIAGTSTGSIIAAALALGWTVEAITKKYFELGSRVFSRSLLRQGLLRAKYDEQALIAELQEVYGAETRLGGPELQTGLLVVIKRIDSGSPWPVSNNPNGRFFTASNDGTIGNGDYRLWQTVRASTAAPTYFNPEFLTIAEAPGRVPVKGHFVDGGVSPFNNPALQAFMYATIGGYGLRWPTGAEHLLLVSIGTGAKDPSIKPSSIAAAQGIIALQSLMDDCAALQEMLLQWMSDSPTARPIDGEVDALAGDLLGGTPALAYVRYNADLRADAVRELTGDDVSMQEVRDLTAMDAPENMDALYRVGRAAGARDVKASHFPGSFDLPPEQGASGRE